MRRLQSGSAILDVKGADRNRLRRLLADGGSAEVVIRGTINTVFGADDGTSLEFVVDLGCAEVVALHGPVGVPQRHLKHFK